MSALSGSTIGFNEPARSPRKFQAESVAAALHELSERLTAANNYVAASHKLLELEHAEPLGKALTQLERAVDILGSLREVLREEGP